MKNYLLPFFVLWIMVALNLQAMKQSPEETAPTSLGPDSWQKSRNGNTIRDYEDMIEILNQLTDGHQIYHYRLTEDPISEKKASDLWKRALEVKEAFRYMQMEQKLPPENRVIKWQAGFNRLPREKLLIKALGKAKMISVPLLRGHNLANIIQTYVWTKNHHEKFNQLKKHYGEQINGPKKVPSLFERALSVFRSSDQKATPYEESVIQETSDRKFKSAQINDPAMVELQKKSKTQLDSLLRQGLIYSSSHFQAIKHNRGLYKKKYPQGIQGKTAILTSYDLSKIGYTPVHKFSREAPEVNLLSFSDQEIETLRANYTGVGGPIMTTYLHYQIAIGSLVKHKAIKKLDLNYTRGEFDFHNPYVIDDLSHSLTELMLPPRPYLSKYLSECLKGLTKLQKLDLPEVAFLNPMAGLVCRIVNSPKVTSSHSIRKISAAIAQDEEMPEEEFDTLLKKGKIQLPPDYRQQDKAAYKKEFKFMKTFHIGEVTLHNIWVKKCPPRTEKAKLKFLRERDNFYPEFNRENLFNEVGIVLEKQ